jgi:hypothetical protein
MKHTIRLVVTAAAAGLALAFAGSALAAFTPKLVVVAPNFPGAGPAVSFSLSVPSDANTGKVQIYVPTGYQLNAPTPPRKVGNVTAASFTAADNGNQALPMKGQITAVQFSDPTIVAQQQSCDGTTSHAAAWLMQLSGGGQSLTIPIYVDHTTGNKTTFGLYTMTMCLPPSDVAQGTAGRAPVGARLTSLLFDLSAFTNPAKTGQFTWRSVWTPYQAGNGQLNTAGNVEADGIVRLPTAINLNAKVIRTQRLTKTQSIVRQLISVTGNVFENHIGIGNVLVRVHALNSKGHLVHLGQIRTRSDGSFTYKIWVKQPTKFWADVTVPNRQLTLKCVSGLDVAIPCVNAWIGGSHPRSNPLTVRAR